MPAVRTVRYVANWFAIFFGVCAVAAAGSMLIP